MVVSSHWHVRWRHTVDSRAADCLLITARCESAWRSCCSFECNITPYCWDYNCCYGSRLHRPCHRGKEIQMLEIRYDWMYRWNRYRAFLFSLWCCCRANFRCAYRRVRVWKESCAGIVRRDWIICWISFRRHHEVVVLCLYCLLFLSNRQIGV